METRRIPVPCSLAGRTACPPATAHTGGRGTRNSPGARLWVGFEGCQGLVGRREESSRGCSHRTGRGGWELGERVLCKAKRRSGSSSASHRLAFLTAFSSTPPSANVNSPFWTGGKKKGSLGQCQPAALGYGGLASGRDAGANRLPWEEAAWERGKRTVWLGHL